MAAAAQLPLPTIRSIHDEILSEYITNNENEHYYITQFGNYLNYDMDFGEYDNRLEWDTNLVTYNDQGQQVFFHVNNEPYILRLIYDMIENEISMILNYNIQGKGYAFLEKYNLKDAYDAYKGLFKEKANAILNNSEARFKEELKRFKEEINTESDAPASSANGGRRSKRSHRKTRKGKSRKHRSKGGRRGKSRKH